MPTETVLVQIVTAANLAGIEQAKASLLGLQAQTIAMAAAFTLLVVVGKSAVENAKAQEEAFDQLTQAYATQKDTLDAHRQAILEFVAVNARFIRNQYDTETAMAQVIRAGYDTTDMFRIMNDALDLAAIKNEDVSEATRQLILVLAGNGRALRELGITTEQYNAIMKSTLTTEQKHDALLRLIEQHTAKGRDTIDGLAASQNELNKSWQDFTAKIGPPLLTIWRKLNEAAATGIGILSVYVDLLEKIWKLEGQINLGAPGNPMPSGGYNARGHRAMGGSVSAGGAYTVGEHGPETLVMGAASGSIVPNGAGRAGTTVNLTIQGGMFMDHGPTMDAFINALLRHARFRPGM